VYDLGHRCNVKRVALDRGLTVGAVKLESTAALDALLGATLPAVGTEAGELERRRW